MSLKKNLYLTIKQVIENDYRDEIKTFRLFNNQFESENIENAFLYPAIFMEFENIDYIGQTNASYTGDFLITFHVGIHALGDEDLQIFDLLDTLRGLLSDMNIGFKLNRESQDTNHGNVIVWTQSHMVNLLDDTTNISKGRTLPTGVVELEINKELIIDPLTVDGIRTDDKIS